MDFSEEKEDKGFILIEVEKGQVKWQFCPLTVRSFCTIKVDLSKSDDPLQTLIKVIEKITSRCSCSVNLSTAFRSIRFD